MSDQQNQNFKAAGGSFKISISYETAIDPELLEKVEKVVESNTFGATVADVKRALNINRSTAKRYLEALVSLGRAKKEKRGIMTLYYKTNIQ